MAEEEENEENEFQSFTFSFNGTKRTFNGDDERSNEIVTYRGLSLAAVHHIMEEVQDGTYAPETKLYVLKEEVDGVSAGTTVSRVSKKKWKPFWSSTSMMVQVPYRKELLKVKRSQLEPKDRKNWSIEDYCEYVVHPIVSLSGGVFLDILPDEHVGQVFQGAFVSQARKCSFSKLVDALSNHYALKGTPFKDVFVWLDIFSANQPLLTGKDAPSDPSIMQQRLDLLSHGLHEAIANFDEQLFFFDSVENPTPLTRAWCLWELYGSAHFGKEIQVILDDDNEARLFSSLESATISCLEYVTKLELDSVACHDPKDLEMILDAIEQLPGGFAAMKAKVKAAMRAWIVRMIKSEAEIIMSNPEEQEENIDDDATFLINAAVVLASLGDPETAVGFLKTAKEIYLGLEGNRAISGACSALENLAGLYVAMDKPELALETSLEALEMDRHANGLNSRTAPRRLFDVAKAEVALSRFEDALEKFQQLLELPAADLDRANLKLVIVYEEVGILYAKKQDWESALEYFEKAQELEKSPLGVPNVHQLMAVALSNLGRFEESLELAESSFQFFKDNFGEDYPMTLDIMGNMANTLFYHVDQQRGIELQLQVIEILRRKEEAGLPCALAYNNLGSMYFTHEEFGKAKEAYEQALQIALLHAAESETNPLLAQIYSHLALAHCKEEDFETGRHYFQRSLELLPKGFPDTARILTGMGELHWKLNEVAEARRCFEDALEVQQALFGEKHPGTQDILRKLASLDEAAEDEDEGEGDDDEEEEEEEETTLR